MITHGYVRTMAEYNLWQNQNLYGAADGLGDAARREPRGAFFGSIHATLNHLLWADQMGHLARLRQWVFRVMRCSFQEARTLRLLHVRSR